MARQVAVVTGAGGDIGGACARRLAASRDVVLCVDRDSARADETARSIAEHGGRAEVVAADAADPVFGAAVAAAAADLGDVTAVVHALAYEEHVDAVELSRDSLLRSVEVGPVAAFELFRALVRADRLPTGAALTAIGSLHAEHPFPRCLGYNAAHAALAQIVRTLAHEWAPRRIRVNAVVPGWIRTRGEALLYQESYLDSMAARLPFGRFGTVDDVAGAVDYLSSVGASYVSGTLLTVDGALGVSRAVLGSHDE
ncbi:SDR family NAD(P)-dependent oxidoreductase [Actinocrispum wychmicini]|uniref:Glucose 1-dehydrogenase n=1 Tax=Actinocrispum wychmicini TaxID=1213861 RepID=A0A4R2JHJ1_9PSEU|nr:SDR family oxidoreductase [Actinocrispum wychmicini]TCO55859.1 glucose 1-dehydrogenase [Actinocrispum wychmicini]